MSPKVANNNKDREKWWVSLSAALGAEGVAAAVLMCGLSARDAVTRFILIGLGGVIGVLAALALVSIALTHLGLSDKKEALGLPEGSIRAIIALSLIVFFIICTVFYFQVIASPTEEINGITQEQLSNITASQIIATYPDGNETYTVVLQRIPSQAATDFAKQVVTTLATLVVAVSAFYFGTRTTVARILEAGTRLTSISVTSGSSDALKVGSTRQFSATGMYADGAGADITSQVAWKSSDPTKATVTSPGGLATGVEAGQTKITASQAGVSGTADLEVTN